MNSKNKNGTGESSPKKEVSEETNVEDVNEKGDINICNDGKDGVEENQNNSEGLKSDVHEVKGTLSNDYKT